MSGPISFEDDVQDVGIQEDREQRDSDRRSNEFLLLLPDVRPTRREFVAPPEIDQEQIQALNSPETKEELQEFARNDDQEGFNQHILAMSTVEPGGMEASLPPEMAQAVIESDYFMRLRVALLEQPASKQESIVEPETLETLQSEEVASRLEEAAGANDRAAFEDIIREVLGEEQAYAVICSDYWRNLVDLHQRIQLGGETRNIVRAQDEGDTEAEELHGRAALRIAQGLEEQGAGDADTIVVNAIRDARIRREGEQGRKISYQEFSHQYGDSLRRLGDAIGIDSEAIETLLAPQQFEGVGIASKTNITREDIEGMSAGQVIQQMLIQRALSETRRRRERERRQTEEEREKSEAEDEERAEIERLLQQRLRELVGEDADPILEGIDNGQIGLARVSGTTRSRTGPIGLGVVPSKNYVTINGVDFEDTTETRALSALQE